MAIPSLDHWLNYEAYSRSQMGTDEGGNAVNRAIPKEQWEAMSTEDKWRNIQLNNTQMMIHPGEEGYDDLKEQLGVEDGRPIWITPFSPLLPTRPESGRAQ